MSNLEESKPPWFWIKNSKGVSSASVTLLLIAFVVTTFAYIVSMFENIGPFSIRPFDIGACSTYFIPILTLYFGRRLTDIKFLESKDKEET